MKSILNVLFLLILTALVNAVYSQNITRRIVVVSGGNVPFTFNSLTQYNSGFTYNNWTRLNIYYNDTTNTGAPGSSNGWAIMVEAQSATFISESGPAVSLPLGTLQISAQNNTLPAPPAPTLINIDLTNSPQVIATSDKIINVTGTILISYNLGKPPNTNVLLGKLPDFYSVNLIFTINPLP